MYGTRERLGGNERGFSVLGRVDELLAETAKVKTSADRMLNLVMDNRLDEEYTQDPAQSAGGR
jgi:hypothetical protein